MDSLGAESGLRIVVLRGNGKHFQAGADLSWITAVATQSPAENEKVSRLTAEAVKRLDTCPVPTLALIQAAASAAAPASPRPATSSWPRRMRSSPSARRAGA